MNKCTITTRDGEFRGKSADTITRRVYGRSAWFEPVKRPGKYGYVGCVFAPSKLVKGARAMVAMVYSVS